MGWYEALKDALTVADQLKNAELKQKLADVQVECAKLAEENARLRQELIELREQTQTRQEMEYHDNVYWRQLPGGKREGPFCPKCIDGDRKKARMSERRDDNFWRCPVCGCCIEKPGSGGWRTGRAETDYDPFSS
jgi:regulator of replication initiation timing